jgi:lysophospholipase L1-like esterase
MKQRTGAIDGPIDRPVPPSRGRRVLFALVTLFALALAVEGAARVASWTLRQRTPRPPLLDGYKIADEGDPSLWRLRPGYIRSIDELIAAKRSAGKLLAVEHYRSAQERLALSGDTVALRINSDGYRGPELDGTGRATRWLTLGDSCTFGTIEEYTYPRVLERELRRVAPVEVVNGAVEGYAPRHVLARLEEFKRLRPAVTILYIGWNALYAEHAFFEAHSVGPAADPTGHLAGIRLARRAALALMRGRLASSEEALATYLRAKRPDAQDPVLRLLHDYTPSFLGDVERISVELRDAGSIVVLVTLPGLYRTGEPPSARALAVGHLPRFTDNPYVLAAMAERYNDALRHLAAQHDLELVDLDQWSRRELDPPERFFFDSVHLWEEGQARIGTYLAETLAHHLNVPEGGGLHRAQSM